MFILTNKKRCSVKPKEEEEEKEGTVVETEARKGRGPRALIANFYIIKDILAVFELLAALG